MSNVVIRDRGDPSVPVVLIAEDQAQGLIDAQPAPVRALARLHGFTGRAGQVLLAHDARGAVERVLAGMAPGEAMSLRALPARLPGGDYRLAEPLPAGIDPAQAAIAWGLGAYRFDRYRRATDEVRARLAVGDGLDLRPIEATLHACALARDMINTPANDMGPRQIEIIAREVAESFGATIAVTVGEELLAQNYPAVHAVGRAATHERAPRMIEISWTPPSGPAAPLVALVGKGVVFDTGGLDIKPSSAMRAMKKDMGGAAHALALARMIMAAALPVRLAVLLPVAENAISGDAMRPGDILASRKGLSIEVGNTDAEGRLILADALARAAELEPDLTIDLATLTGAARAALGPQVAPFYTADDDLAASLAAASLAVGDPVWRMPLWRPYAEAIEGDIADLKNDPDAWAQAGSITAALFLQKFAPAASWLHLDIFAWNARARPGWPAGAEVQAVRALMAMLAIRYPPLPQS